MLKSPKKSQKLGVKLEQIFTAALAASKYGASKKCGQK
jgi:hypothetical protein